MAGLLVLPGTEEVIRTALATGDASVQGIAQGVEHVAKGKW
ncbi:hypothetical protein [Streptomyces sp. NPDC002785]